MCLLATELTSYSFGHLLAAKTKAKVKPAWL
jgi:hypothetical protein